MIAAWLVLAAAGAPASQVNAEVPLLAEIVELDRLDAATTSGQTSIAVDGLAGRVLLDVAATAPVSVQIQTPQGSTLDASNVAAFGGSYDGFSVAGAAGVTHLGLLAQPGFHETFEFVPPQAGSYTVLYDAGPLLAQEAAVVVRAASDSSLRAALVATSRQVVVGEDRAVLAALFFEGPAPVPGLSLVAELVSDQGESAAVTLADDGLGDDAAAGDGIYTGSYAPLAAGRFTATLDASGQASDLSTFRRTLASGFDSVAPRARLTGTFTDQPIDTDADGRTDLLRLSFDVTPPTAGEYQARVRLRTAGGTPIDVAATLLVAASDATVPVDVPASLLRDGGEDGPWTVESVELGFVDPVLGPRRSSRATGLGPTSALLLSALDGPDVVLAGPVSDVPADTDGDGDFDELAVSVGVSLAIPGPYRWSLELAAADGTEIGFASGAGNLSTPSASIAVVFDGARIGQAGQDGPWVLRDLLIAPYDPALPTDPGPPGSGTVIAQAGFTQAWAASQFTGFASPGGGGSGCSCRVGDASGVGWTPTLALLAALAGLGALARREAQRS